MTAIRTGVRIVLVHGNRPTPHSIVWKVLAMFRALGARIETWQDAPDLPPAAFARADLVILRSVHPATAVTARASAPPGTAWCNEPAATATVADRVETWRRLVAAGLPVPGAQVVDDPRAVSGIAAGRPVVAKTPLGSRGKGVTLLDQGDAFPAGSRGPWLVQDRIPGDGWDRKLFVVGPHVHGTLRRWPARSLAEKLGRPLRPDAEMADLALGAGRVFGLCAYGVDMIGGTDGPVIVDVNAFPGFKGVPGAAGLLFDHLLGHLEGRHGHARGDSRVREAGLRLPGSAVLERGARGAARLPDR